MLKMRQKMAILVIIVFTLGVVILITSAETTNDDPKAEPIIECVKAAETSDVNVGAIPREYIEDYMKCGRDILITREQADDIQRKYEERLNQIYTGKIYSVWAKNEKDIIDHHAQTYLKEGEYFDVQIDAGCLDYDLEKVTYEGNRANISGTIIVWTTHIEKIPDSADYVVRLGFAKDYRVDQLIEEGGQWKIEWSDVDYLGSPEAYDSEKGRYRTLVEALNAVEALSPQKESPFIFR